LAGRQPFNQPVHRVSIGRSAAPPWFDNRAKRLVKTPKLHFGDTGLACNLLRCSAAELDELGW